jgi:hypothetical protein
MSGNFVKKKKRNLSPEARARIVAAVKARWARERKRAQKINLKMRIIFVAFKKLSKQ